jgi:DNA polymerase elongation subunit (family B)
MQIDNYISVTQRGDKLLVRGLDSDGKPVNFVEYDFKPYLYIQSNKNVNAVGLMGEKLKRVDFDSIESYGTWLKEQKAVGIPVHGDLGTPELYISELPKKRTVTKDDLTVLYYDIETTVDLNLPPSKSVLTAPEAITLISAYDTNDRKVRIFYYTDFDLSEVEKYDDDICKKYEVVYIRCNDEKDLLTKFLQYWVQLNPHIISGWNTNGFDNPYLYKRMSNLLGKTNANKLSPFGIVKEGMVKNSFGQEQAKVTFVGIAHYDYLEIYSIYQFGSVPNYKLDTIAEIECGANKLHHDGSFKDFYTNHFSKFVAYNVRDTILVNEIDEATNLMDVALSVAYMCNCNLDDTFGTVKKLDTLMHSELKAINIVIPPRMSKNSEDFPGGYVQVPKVGRHLAIVSVDAASLYPSMIREANISPEAQVHPSRVSADIAELALQATDNDEAFVYQTIDLSCLIGTTYTVTPAGAIYDTYEKGVATQLMEKLYKGRKQNKSISLQHKQNYIEAKNSIKLDPNNQALIDKMNSEFRLYTIFHNMQMAQKILLNSFYGAYSNQNFRYFSLDHAKSITSMGRAGVRHVANKTNDWLRSVFKTDHDFIIAGDTDSIYLGLSPLFDHLNLDPLNNDHYEKAREALTKFVDGPLAKKIVSICEDYAKWKNVPENLLDMEREAIATLGGIFIAKKRYALAVDDMEGVKYDKDSLYYKIVGMDAVKAGSNTKIVRETLTKIIKLVITGTESEVQDVISDFKAQFMSANIEDISTVTACNEIDKWIIGNGVISGTPIGVKSAINYNNYVTNNSIDLPLISEGDKISFVQLRRGNPLGVETFGFLNWSILLHDLEPYIDKHYLYNKNFLCKVEPILTAVNWNHEQRNTLF